MREFFVSGVIILAKIYFWLTIAPVFLLESIRKIFTE
jgi:hypothetical protein